MVAGTPVQQASPEALGPPAAPPQSVRVLHQVFYRSVGAATTSEVMVDSIITAVRSGGPGVSSNGTSSCPRAAPSRQSMQASRRPQHRVKRAKTLPKMGLNLYSYGLFDPIILFSQF